MKRTLVVLIVNLFFAFSYSQELRKPSEGKSMVYFTRTAATGFLINFKYFDGDKYLGKFNHGKFLAYECEPGKHLFWSKSENTDFLEAELEAGKIYIIDSEPQMGAFKAGVKLMPFDNDPNNYKNSKKYERKRTAVLESISGAKEYNISADDLDEAKKDQEDLVKRSMEKYSKRKADGEVYTLLTGTNSYTSTP